ncbi:MAG: HPr-rel-A system PqqD family peptide chaperone [Burkholderiales bacterium]
MTLLWRSWDDEFVVFNVASNQTHLLDAFSAAVLKEIEASPKTMEALIGHFTEELGAESGQVSERLADARARFAELGLIERLDT